MSQPTQRRIELDHEIRYKNKESGDLTIIKHLTMGRMKLGHLRHLPAAVFEGSEESNGIDMQVLVPAMPGLIAALAGIPLEAAEEIDLEDLGKVMESMQDFFGSIQAQNGSTAPGF